MQKYTKFKAGRIVNTFDCDKQTKPLDGNQREREGERRERVGKEGSGIATLGHAVLNTT